MQHGDLRIEVDGSTRSISSWRQLGYCCRDWYTPEQHLLAAGSTECKYLEPAWEPAPDLRIRVHKGAGPDLQNPKLARADSPRRLAYSWTRSCSVADAGLGYLRHLRVT